MKGSERRTEQRKDIEAAAETTWIELCLCGGQTGDTLITLITHTVDRSSRICIRLNRFYFVLLKMLKSFTRPSSLNTVHRDCNQKHVLDQ